MVYLKILLVVDQFDSDNNGTTISARRFAEELKRHGNEVKTASIGKAADRYEMREFKLISIADNIIKKQGMAFARPDRETLEQAIAWADVVHFLMPFWLSLSGLKIAERLGVPHTAAFHVQPENITYTLGMGKMTGVNNAIYSFFRSSFYNRFSHIHCPSRFIAGELEKHGYTAQLHVISNGVDRCFRYRKKAKPAQWADKFVILMIGRLSNEKRQDVLIEAIKKSRHAQRIQLVLAGQGPKREKYEALAADLANPIVIDFYEKPRLLDLLAECDLYVHAADAEIEAISCMEAFSSGLVPIIANSPKSATPQFALDDRSLFEAGSSDDLAAKIDYWLENESQRRIMEIRYALHGRQYGIDACVSQIEEMFRQAMEEAEDLHA